MSGGILFSLDCFLVRNTVFRCSRTFEDMTMSKVGMLQCSTNLVQGSGDIVFYCSVESRSEFGNGVLIGRSVGNSSPSIGVRTEA